MKKSIQILLLVSIGLLTSCQTLAIWNPNGQPENKLAFLQVLSNTDKKMDILALDGTQLTKALEDGDSIKISTAPHEISIGVVVGHNVLKGGNIHAARKLVINTDKINEPGAKYILTWDYGFLGKVKSEIKLKKSSFFLDSTLQTWSVELVGNNEWKVTF